MLIKSAKNGFALPLFLVIVAIGIIAYFLISLKSKPLTLTSNVQSESLAIGTTEPVSSPSPASSPSTADTTPPYIYISNPLGDFKRVSGVVTISAFVQDDSIASISSGITKVEFYIDDKLIDTDTSPNPPYYYSTTWDTTNLRSDYYYNITAKAYDGAGNVGSASRAAVTALPVITITNPPAGTTVKAGDTINITASVIGNIPVVEQVGFLVDSNYLCLDTTLPFSYSCKWKVLGSQDRYKDGKITIQANFHYGTNYFSTHGGVINEVIVNFTKSR